VLDDAEYKVLRWIVKNKSKSPIWRDQVTTAIQSSLHDNVTFFKDWVGWESFVKKMDEESVSVDGDGGGKRKAKKLCEKPGCIYELGSPLKWKKNPCTVHDWKPETNKAAARKETGNYLDNIKCEGYNKKCEREFVEELHLAKEGMGIVVSLKKPAYWCQDCKLVYCFDCHSAMMLDDAPNGIVKSARRRLL
jgi:hypothetical protein